jgi:hypothetical protein
MTSWSCSWWHGGCTNSVNAVAVIVDIFVNVATVVVVVVAIANTNQQHPTIIIPNSFWWW